MVEHLREVKVEGLKELAILPKAVVVGCELDRGNAGSFDWRAGNRFDCGEEPRGWNEVVIRAPHWFTKYKVQIGGQVLTYDGFVGAVAFVDAGLVAGVVERLLASEGFGRLGGVVTIIRFILTVVVVNEVGSGGEPMSVKSCRP
jgi:hypothetical protein